MTLVPSLTSQEQCHCTIQNSSYSLVVTTSTSQCIQERFEDMAVRTHDKPLRAEGDGDVNKCVNNLIEAFANGLDIFKRLRERRRKHKARKESQAPEPINSAELQLSNSLRRGPQDLAERYDECYSQAGMGRRFATGDCKYRILFGTWCTRLTALSNCPCVSR